MKGLNHTPPYKGRQQAHLPITELSTRQTAYYVPRVVIRRVNCHIFFAFHQICEATPCCSISTGMQCEMDPVSQTQACEHLAGRGCTVVGWYHSHPRFAASPSVRDIETQAKFQVGWEYLFPFGSRIHLPRKDKDKRSQKPAVMSW